jgi:cell migration-inducing and hyaluronan-binding protein
MEDGIEHGNEFVRNLAIQTKCHPTLDCVPTNLAANGERDSSYADRAAYREASFHGGNTLLPSDNTVSSFWITNPDNSYIDNVAAGSDQVGFWLSIPEHPNGAFLGTEASLNTWPRRTPLRAFRGNTAHSNFDGFLIDRHIDQDNTFGLASIPLLPLADPTDLESEVMETHFENLTSYKNRNGGLWGRGDLYVYSNMKLADNAIGMTQAAGDIGSLPFSARLVDALVVGESDNIGNPTTPEEVAYGAACPSPPSGLPHPRLRILRLPRRCGEHDIRELPGQRPAKDRRAVLPAVHECGAQYRKHHQRCRVRQRQAGLFSEIRFPVR